MLNDSINIGIKGHVNITENYKDGTSKVLLEKANAVNPANMARILARALAHEPNSYIWRLALGNGGVQYGSDGTLIYNPPNVNSWNARLYNETYSEIVDGTSALVGTDPGDADANGIRPGGGADPSDDPAPNSVVSQEVGTKSNVIVTLYINSNEPTGQLLDNTTPSTGAANEFNFSELGLYSSSAQPRATSGYSSVNVGNSTSSGVSVLLVNTSYNCVMTVDGTSYTCVIKTPISGTGGGGAITYGDICEGINGGTWIISGDSIQNYVYAYITDDSGGNYPSILNAQSYGLLNFQSKSTGSTSSVNLSCTTGSSTDFFNSLVSGICGNVNNPIVSGTNAGVQNDPLNSTHEAERLLTHLIFAPIRKDESSTLVITYTLTVSVNPTISSITNELPSIPQKVAT